MRRVCLTWTAVAAVLLSVPIASAVAEDGKLSVTADKWVAYLYSTGRPLVVRGGKEPVNVAAGSYRIRFMVSSVKDDQTATISGMLKGTTEIKAGQTTEIKTGGPIEASIEAKVEGKKVSFSMSAKDAGGNAVSIMATEKGKPIKPKVEVVKGDKVVYSSTLEYGWGGTCSHTWGVPSSLSGKLEARLILDTKAIELKSQPTTIELE